MNEREHDREFEDYLAGRSPLSDSYRRLGSVEPSAEIDARIMAEARRAVVPARRPWWRRAPAYAVAAVLVLGLSVLVSQQVMYSPPPPADLYRVPTVPAKSRDAAPPATLSAPGLAEEAEPDAVARPARQSAPGDQAEREATGRVSAAPAAAASLKSEGTRLRPGGDSAVDDRPAESRPGSDLAAEAPETEASVSTDTGMPTAPATPEAWMARIETLIDEDEISEAREELRRFRRSFPDYPLPERAASLLQDPPQGQ